ncbi:hypothetical protein V9T40_004185 [Parthenolecanium corni]|uniref:Uncharacterized protein n=1 Tax=Parthenolecanium corni TaxID=536013 RepID=A0AAN9TUF4_9HEMI
MMTKEFKSRKNAPFRGCLDVVSTVGGIAERMVSLGSVKKCEENATYSFEGVAPATVSDGRGESLVDYERGERREGKCLCCCDMEVYIEVEEAYGTLAELEWNVKMAKLSQPNLRL